MNITMKFAKPTEADMTAAMTIMQILNAVEDGNYPPAANGCFNETDPNEFDETDDPYGKVGDWLWVRENGWQPPQLSSRDLREGADTWPKYIYDADASDESEWCREHQWKRRPSIHMPRWASRILLEITEVRVERLNEISETDALAEGIEKVIRPQPNGDVWHTFVTSGVPTNLHYYATARQAFRQLWQKINGPNSWEVNPWVWVVSFNRVESPI